MSTGNEIQSRDAHDLSNELETDRISAEMKDGVLTLNLPKRAELQPRKIEINAVLTRTCICSRVQHSGTHILS